MAGARASALVTGSRGFLGRHLCARLRAERWDVRELEGRLHSMDSLGRGSDAVDVVFHCAAVSGSRRFDARQAEGYDANVAGTQAVLSYCRRVGARCVYTSSSAVYGPVEGDRVIGEESPIGPASAYGMSKWLAERLCERMWLDEGVSTTALRVFNPYGAGQESSFLVPYVMDCLLRGRPLVLRSPDAVRDFIYVDDVVEAMVRAALGLGAGFHVLNAGSGERTSVLRLAELAQEVLGAAVSVETPFPDEDATAVVADTSKARAALGWAPRYDLRSGLTAMKESMGASSGGDGRGGRA